MYLIFHKSLCVINLLHFSFCYYCWNGWINLIFFLYSWPVKEIRNKKKRPKNGLRKSLARNSPLVRLMKMSFAMARSSAKLWTKSSQAPFPKSTLPVVNSRWWKTSTCKHPSLITFHSGISIKSSMVICGNIRLSSFSKFTRIQVSPAPMNSLKISCIFVYTTISLASFFITIEKIWHLMKWNESIELFFILNIYKILTNNLLFNL